MVKLRSVALLRVSLPIEYGEDSRDFMPNVPTKTNPNFNPSANAQLIIEETKKGEVGFWENAWTRMSGAAS